MNRPLLAFLLAPLVSAVTLASLQGELVMTLFFAPIAYMFALPGIPAYFLFRWLGWLRPWQVIAGGAVLGMLVSLSIRSGVDWSDMQVLGCAGAFTGGVFWIIVFWRAPDRAA